MKRTILTFTLIILPVAAIAEGTKLTFTTGFDYSSGKYGQNDSTKITYIPFTGKLEQDHWTFKATIPWVQIDGPSDVTVGDTHILLGNNVKRRSIESGLGDVVTSVTYSAFESTKHGLFIDVGGKIKFGTASHRKGLGTGENDYAAEVDIYKSVDKFTLMSSLGYRVLGDPSGVDLNNVWFGMLGGAYKFSPQNNMGLLIDWREPTSQSGSHLREYTLYHVHKFNSTYKLQSYLVHGDTQSSVDIGGGIMLGVSW